MLKHIDNLRMIKGLKKSNYLRRLVFSFLLIGGVVFSAFSYIVAVIVNTSYNNNLEKINLKAVSQASSTSSIVLGNLFQFL